MPQQPAINPFPALPSPMPFMPTPQFPDMQTVEKTLKEQMEKAITEMVKNPEHDFHRKVKEMILNISEDEKFVDKLKRKFLTKEEYKKHKKELEKKYEVIDIDEDDEEDEEDEEKDHLCKLFCCINYHHLKIREGKSIFDVEKEILDKHKDLSNEEHKVLYALLKSDGPVALSHAVGMELDDFIETMKSLGKKLHAEH